MINREILFRGKQMYDNSWVYGFYANDGKNHFIQYETRDTEGQTNFVEKEVHPETVGQFTSLTDKNGKKIFEGDIVLFSWAEDKNKVPFYIEFVQGEFRATPKEITENVWSIRIAGYTSDFEVIGNIHDNPELLEQE